MKEAFGKPNEILAWYSEVALRAMACLEEEFEDSITVMGCRRFPVHPTILSVSTENSSTTQMLLGIPE